MKIERERSSREGVTSYNETSVIVHYDDGGSLPDSILSVDPMRQTLGNVLTFFPLLIGWFTLLLGGCS